MLQIQKNIQTTCSKLHTLKPSFILRPLTNDKGDGYLDVAMKVLMAIVIGVVLLAVLNAAVPDLFTSLINRITTELAAS